MTESNVETVMEVLQHKWSSIIEPTSFKMTESNVETVMEVFQHKWSSSIEPSNF